jgi:hypothetical protein
MRNSTSSLSTKVLTTITCMARVEPLVLLCCCSFAVCTVMVLLFPSIKIIIVIFTIVEHDDMGGDPPIFVGREASSVHADPCGARRARDVAL